MLRYLSLSLIVILGMVHGISFANQHNFQKNGVCYVWEKEPNAAESKKMYVDAFVKCYNRIPLEVLRKTSREEMVRCLEESFDETYADCQDSKSHLWLSAKVEGHVVGFLVIDVTKYPEEIYMAQMAVDPACQRRGIGSSMIQSLYDQFSDCGKFVVITRIANDEARGLYNALGYSPSSYMHEGYSRELYTGFEYIPIQLPNR